MSLFYRHPIEAILLELMLRYRQYAECIGFIIILLSILRRSVSTGYSFRVPSAATKTFQVRIENDGSLFETDSVSQARRVLLGSEFCC